MACLRRRQR